MARERSPAGVSKRKEGKTARAARRSRVHERASHMHSSQRPSSARSLPCLPQIDSLNGPRSRRKRRSISSRRRSPSGSRSTACGRRTPSTAGAITTAGTCTCARSPSRTSVSTSSLAARRASRSARSRSLVRRRGRAAARRQAAGLTFRLRLHVHGCSLCDCVLCQRPALRRSTGRPLYRARSDVRRAAQAQPQATRRTVACYKKDRKRNASSGTLAGS